MKHLNKSSNHNYDDVRGCRGCCITL